MVVLLSSDEQRPKPPPRELGAAELDVLHDAEQELIGECMRGLGFEYWRYERNPTPEHRSFPYVVDDVHWARKHGYGRDLELAVDREVGTHPNERYVQGLTPERRAAALEALHGSPLQDGATSRLTAHLPSGGAVHHSSRGCTSSAQRTLYGDLSRWYEVTRITEDLVAARRAMVYEDPRLMSAVTPWRTCMHAKGFPVDSPGRARESLPPPGTEVAHQLEVATATAEAVCANATPLAAVAAELDAHYRQVLRDRYRSVFLDWFQLRADALPRATELLGRS